MFNMMKKDKAWMKLGFAGIALGVVGVAQADEVSLAGSVLGQFNLQPYAVSSTLLGLKYDGSTFANTTVGNMLDLGGNPAPGFNFNNLGSFSLDMADHVYNGNIFTIKVTFTAPSVITGSSSAVFSDIVSGTVLNGLGGVYVDFDNTPKVFLFNNLSATGSFTMSVNDVSIAPGQLASVTAHITGNQQAVPEPATLAGLAMGAVAIARRRAKK